MLWYLMCLESYCFLELYSLLRSVTFRPPLCMCVLSSTEAAIYLFPAFPGFACLYIHHPLPLDSSSLSSLSSRFLLRFNHSIFLTSSPNNYSNHISVIPSTLDVDFLIRENKVWKLLLQALTKQESLVKENNLRNTENEKQAKRIDTLEAEARESLEWKRNLTLVPAEKKCCAAKDNNDASLVPASNQKWWKKKTWIAIVVILWVQIWQIICSHVANVAAGETTAALHPTTAQSHTQ